MSLMQRAAIILSFAVVPTWALIDVAGNMWVDHDSRAIVGLVAGLAVCTGLACLDRLRVVRIGAQRATETGATA
jgi:hypothetical protein